MEDEERIRLLESGNALYINYTTLDSIGSRAWAKLSKAYV